MVILNIEATINLRQNKAFSTRQIYLFLLLLFLMRFSFRVRHIPSCLFVYMSCLSPWSTDIVDAVCVRNWLARSSVMTYCSVPIFPPAASEWSVALARLCPCFSARLFYFWPPPHGKAKQGSSTCLILSLPPSTQKPPSLLLILLPLPLQRRRLSCFGYVHCTFFP